MILILNCFFIYKGFTSRLKFIEIIALLLAIKFIPIALAIVLYFTFELHFYLEEVVIKKYFIHSFQYTEMNLKHLSVYAIMIHKKYCIFIVTAFPNSLFFSCLIYFMASV